MSYKLKNYNFFFLNSQTVALTLKAVYIDIVQ